MDKLTLFINQHRVEQKYADLRVGWTVKIKQKIKEGEKAKSQVFEGIIIARKHGNTPGATITVRKMSNGIGVEKILPLRLPTIESIEVTKKSRVRRAKLYYLREKSAKEIRKKTRTETLSASTSTEPVESPVAATE